MDETARTDSVAPALPGRRQLLETLGADPGFGKPLTVAVHIDVCNFDIINLLCGVAASDALLVQLGQRLQEELAGAHLAHLWSDEFVAVFPVDSPATALSRVEKLRTALSALPLPPAAGALPFRASYGVVISANPGDWDAFLHKAQYACREARTLGTNQTHLFIDQPGEELMHGSIAAGASLVEMIRGNKLTIHAQPIFRVGAGNNHRISKVEILLRRKTPTGAVPIPQGFIEVAERFGFVRALDEFVLDEAINWFRQNPKVLHGLDRIAINLSGHTLSDRGFYDLLIKKVCLGGVPPEKLCFEVTETSLVQNLAQMRSLIGELKAMGCSVALDDFGIGQCSFGYLQELPVDEVKIDGSFIKRMSRDPAAARIVEALLAVAIATGKRALAEFVEDADTFQHLRRLGVQYVQGWLFAKAMPLEELGGFMARAAPGTVAAT